MNSDGSGLVKVDEIAGQTIWIHDASKPCLDYDGRSGIPYACCLSCRKTGIPTIHYPMQRLFGIATQVSPRRLFCSSCGERFE